MFRHQNHYSSSFWRQVIARSIFRVASSAPSGAVWKFSYFRRWHSWGVWMAYTPLTLHWLPIKNRIKFKYSTIIFKTLQNSEPVYLRNLISYKPDNGLRSDAKCLLNVPPCKTVLASRAFTVAAPTVWNEIPLDIRKCTSLSNFKLKLKTHFFNLSFNS